MAKTFITDDDSTQIPFLRGILTRSLQETGIAFDLAYSVASQVREELKDTQQVTTRTLQKIVLRCLRGAGLREAALRYRRQRAGSGLVLIEEADGRLVPFSRMRYQRGLEACGLSARELTWFSEQVHEQLAHEEPTIGIDRLAALTYERLRRDINDQAAHRYLIWTDFVRSGRPLVLLIGGTAGCGKSTVAASLASRLDIVRTQSTDMLQEIMRVMIPEGLVPALHRSSFDAWRGLPGHETRMRCTVDALVDGYRAQEELLCVASEAVVQRALRERVSLILEGVHINAPFADRVPREPDAVIVPVMLAVLKRERLGRYLRGRGTAAAPQHSGRYIDHLDEIWMLQAFLMEQADDADIPIIENTNPGDVFDEVMLTVIERLAAGFTRTPRDVFGDGARSPKATPADASPS